MKTIWLKLIMPLAFAATIAVTAGCGSFSKPYPEKTLHALDFGNPPPSATPAMKVVLRIDPVRVADPFDGTSFVYKTGTTTFKQDYYNCFVAAPSRLLTGELSTWMSKSGVFSTIVNGDSAAQYQLSLETNVTAMYGQYAGSDTPQAVIEARFFVIDQSNGRFDVIFDKRYRQSQLTNNKSADPDALVRAWNLGWSEIMTALVKDLATTSTVRSVASAR